MKSLLALCSLSALLCAAPVTAQYVGPNSAATHINQLSGLSSHDQFVTLQGHITRRASKDLYAFTDGSGNIYLDIDDKHWAWPLGSPVDAKTRLEIQGKYIGKAFGFSKVKVIGMRVLN
ncbi:MULTISPECIES: NirD/YgiW/YdeI family stress tolerance protein [unclassified Uliginosibacterium]|jgi:uncharacterized protein (TIGR00156 family)|uniref:NirD/YgiW/YdeI family stress tolerance protein n=1 Tax=unclassified Uliginosibacterium TaxID=2621521 RepID=UPI000C7A8504|nr:MULTISPECIES: NirD/YgiW/YdeI family stress tolerance protein [unclassified Uliginosibacterium]MDO6386744.1 NirD/YgiW/YdeI family stress tolerance protein [Uliginosibacterium sp. 31-12]PLK50565.1 hypothetical protein C0V76_01720 [Uliginosibacterium sp. TH139]